MSPDERMAAAGWLAASISHELTGPLQNILTAAELLAPKDARVETILKEARRCERIVRAMLALARGEPGIDDQADVSEILREAVDGRDRIRWTPADTPLPVRGNPTLLYQVFANLLNNALHADPRGDVHLRASRAGADVRIEVIDRGPGVPPADRARIFDAFYSTKPSGPGLGLPICRHIVESLGGRLRFEETPGGGATFVVELPTA